MRVSVGGRGYELCDDVRSRPTELAGYFKLAETVFGLDFARWHESGYWDEAFTPYVLFDGDAAVASAAVCYVEVAYGGTKKRYTQLSTVMTRPDYRGRGLGRRILEYALDAARTGGEVVYLYANDSVADFYPKFGFTEFSEHEFTRPMIKNGGARRRLDINDACDLELLIEKYFSSNPFAEVRVKNFGLFMLHMLTSHANDAYYLTEHDAVAIAGHDGEWMTCYDIFADGGDLYEMLGAAAVDETRRVRLGFAPNSIDGFEVNKSREEDNHLFVMDGTENIFADNKIMLPLLSRA